MGLLACLTAALLSGLVVSRLDSAKVAFDEVYLQTARPQPTTARILTSPEIAATKLPPLGRVARPGGGRARGTHRADASPTAVKRRDSVDGHGAGLPARTDVDPAGGAGRAGSLGAGPSVTRLEAAAVDLTNQERALKGCAPLRVDPRLTRAARAHSRDMAAREYFGHTSADGASPWTRMARAGYSDSAAENIARGYESAEETVRGWMANAGHRRNILNCRITSVGVGVAHGSGDIWWTQDFGYS